MSTPVRAGLCETLEKMSTKRILFFTVVLAINFSTICGHGRVRDPAHRGHAWREGFDTPIDWNDTSNFCGGFSTQWIQNGGKCGLCGDNYAEKQPRKNENGGVYGTGTIVRTYQVGSDINVTVELTASHLGHFEFSLCPLKSGDELETEECFDAHKLELATGGLKYTKVDGVGLYDIKLLLPKNVVCDHCVFRWHYRTGNSWGVCEDGHGALGCGRQETFRTCSDIKIV